MKLMVKLMMTTHNDPILQSKSMLKIFHVL